MLPPLYTEWQDKAHRTFLVKRAQYGESWRYLSLPSLIDLLLIKAQRIHTLLRNAALPATGEPPVEDWLSLVNYAALAILKLRASHAPTEEALKDILEQARRLLACKNADYGEAWRHMRPLAFIEFILMKLERIRHMDSQPDKNEDAIIDNLLDIMNYALLYLTGYGGSFTPSPSVDR
ncbi:MAG: DUF1599 domain-containing protein [Bacteroidia bacterium]|nr:DUF1599 domain-containing protein [Bacteroidia bacterium]MDW8088407.1 DUF1599 domain-containing protein [Bacteroidia bacterium]